MVPAVLALGAVLAAGLPSSADGAQGAPAAQAGGCVAGAWTTDPAVWSMPGERAATEHFSLRWDDDEVSAEAAAAAGAVLEDFWAYDVGPLEFPEPFCDSAVKYRVNVGVDPSYALTGGVTAEGAMGMWIGSHLLGDRWGLAHELAHALQGSTRGLRDSPYVGWMWESHANWMTHQLPEFRSDVHCSQLLVDFPHLYYGTTRAAYCNWQLWEYLKDAYGYAAVQQIWSAAPEPGDPGQRTTDPFDVLIAARGWSLADLNDEFGRWAMHNVTWDYVDPDGTPRSTVYRAGYGGYDSRSGERTLRVTTLDAVPGVPGRWSVPFEQAPQRWGYNLVRLAPEPGATSVRVGFRGIVQNAPATAVLPGLPGEPSPVPPPTSGWRWGVVVEGADGLPRYSPMHAEPSGSVEVDVRPGDRSVTLVVLAAPTAHQRIATDAPYYSVYRYPWTVDVAGAVPEEPPPPGGAPHPNGGGWVADAASVAATAYVGPDARVLAGTVRDDARIEDRATVLGGVVEGSARVQGVSLVRPGAVIGGSAVVSTAFRGVGAFGAVRVDGTAQVRGDAEVSATSLGQGTWYGRVDEQVAATSPMRGLVGPVAEVTRRPAAADLAAEPPAPQSPGAENVAPLATPTASYTAGWNRVQAVNDGAAHNTGGDQTAIWGTWTGSEPATRWLQYTWAEPVTVDGSALSFWYDQPQGSGVGVAVPRSWSLEYWDADAAAWVGVPGVGQVAGSWIGFTSVRFDPLTTTSLRATFALAPDEAGTARSAVAVSEWAVLAADPGDPDDPGGPDDPGDPELPSFSDVPASHPFYDEITWLASEGITRGYADGTFRGTAPVNRDAMAAFVYRLVTGEQSAPACTSAPFADVAVSHPFCGEIAWMKAQGLSAGYFDGTYRPATAVARDAMAAFIYRLVTGEASAPRAAVAPFTDVPVTHPFAGEIAWLKAQGLAQGWPDGTFRPSVSIERQAMAAFLYRLVNHTDLLDRTIAPTGPVLGAQPV